LQHVSALGKADANVINDVGVCHFELRQHDEALQCFTAALDLDSKHAPSCSNRANCYKNLGQHEEAERDYTRAIEIDNTNPKAFLSRASLLDSLGRRDDALKDYERVVALQPKHEFALKKLMLLTPNMVASASHKGWLYKRGKLNTTYQRRYFLLHGAMINYFESEEAAEQGKTKGSPVVSRIAHVRPAQVAELSAEKASLAFQFESSEAKTFVVYAESAEDKLGWLTQLAAAMQIGQREFKRVTVEKAYASQMLAAESAADARASAADAGPANSKEGGGWMQVVQGARAVQAGQSDQARMLLTKASEASDGHASGVFIVSNAMLGALLNTKHMYSEAARHLALAARNAPRNCAQHLKLQLAWAQWHIPMPENAETTYDDVLDDDVLCWQALVDRARMRLKSGTWALAMADLVQVAAMGKADADACNDLGVTHFELGNDERAAHFFSEAINKNDRHAPAIANRANCLKRQGKLREAEEDYTRAIEIDDRNPKAFINRAALLREQGLNTRAKRDLERALQIDPTDAGVRFELKQLTDKLQESGISDGGGGTTSGDAPAETAEPLRRERL